MLQRIKTLASVVALSVSLIAGNTQAADTTLRGASLFDNDHAYSKTLIKFSELVNEYYDGDVAFDLRGNSCLLYTSPSPRDS